MQVLSLTGRKSTLPDDIFSQLIVARRFYG